MVVVPFDGFVTGPFVPMITLSVTKLYSHIKDIISSASVSPEGVSMICQPVILYLALFWSTPSMANLETFPMALSFSEVALVVKLSKMV